MTRTHTKGSCANVLTDMDYIKHDYLVCLVIKWGQS